ncbi:MAG: hypothetical protein PUB41_03580 [bacterium]|nr:hypothetical protein [bacterium]
MTKKIISAFMTLTMMCLFLAGCGCEKKVETVLDSKEVAKASVEQLMNDITDAINNQDRDAYTRLTTDKMRSSSCDVNKYFSNIKEFILKEIAFDTGKQTGATYEMLIHYFITFDDGYQGTRCKVGINNMTDRFVIVKEGDTYKLDNIIDFGS